MPTPLLGLVAALGFLLGCAEILGIGAPTPGGLGGSGATGGGGWTSGNGGGGDTSGGGVGGAGACGSGDTAEPNDTEALSLDLGAINDSDSGGGIVQGTLTTAGDIDWFRYTGSDTTFYVADPARTFVASGPARLCKFLECLDGGPVTFDCPSGTQPATSPEGRAGCCGTAGFGFSHACPSSVDDAIVFIRVDSPQSPDCIDYSVGYHF